MPFEVGGWTRLNSPLILFGRKGNRKTIRRTIKVCSMARGKIQLGFLAILVLFVSLAGVAGVLRSNAVVGMDGSSSVLFAPNVLIDKVFGTETGVSASTRWPLASWFTWWWSSSAPISSLIALYSSSAAASGSSAGHGGLQQHNESNETTMCPRSCFRPNPVCGVDGITYWCGSVDAQCAGVEVDYMGFCDFGSKGTGDKGVLAIQSLLLVHMIWLMLAGFLVLIGVP